MAKDGVAAKLDRLFERAVSTADIHSAVAAVERTDGSFFWSAATGDATPTAAGMTTDTPYFVASISKLYLAVVVMLLVEDGKLRLDESLATYLPADLLAGLHVWKGHDVTRNITLRHLLSNTSGLADYYEERAADGRSFRDRLVANGDADIDPVEALRIVREELRPNFLPQDLGARRVRAAYSDTNFLLLGLIVEAAVGSPLGQVYLQRLVEPLGLRRTWLWRRTEPLSGDKTEPAKVWFGNRPLVLDRAMRGFTEDGIVSTVRDKLRFMRALVTGQVFASPRTLAEMQARWHRIFYPFDYGLGMMRLKLPAIMTLGRLPEMVGHAGSTGTWLFHVPELGVATAGTFNQAASPAKPIRLLARILRLLQRQAA